MYNYIISFFSKHKPPTQFGAEYRRGYKHAWIDNIKDYRPWPNSLLDSFQSSIREYSNSLLDSFQSPIREYSNIPNDSPAFYQPCNSTRLHASSIYRIQLCYCARSSKQCTKHYIIAWGRVSDKRRCIYTHSSDSRSHDSRPTSFISRNWALAFGVELCERMENSAWFDSTGWPRTTIRMCYMYRIQTCHSVCEDQLSTRVLRGLYKVVRSIATRNPRECRLPDVPFWT